MMANELWPVPFMLEAQVEFWAPGFILDQSWIAIWEVNQMVEIYLCKYINEQTNLGKNENVVEQVTQSSLNQPD